MSEATSFGGRRESLEGSNEGDVRVRGCHLLTSHEQQEELGGITKKGVIAKEKQHQPDSNGEETVDGTKVE